MHSSLAVTSCLTAIRENNFLEKIVLSGAKTLSRDIEDLILNVSPYLAFNNHISGWLNLLAIGICWVMTACKFELLIGC